jgi:hypothetical protein
MQVFESFILQAYFLTAFITFASLLIEGILVIVVNSNFFFWLQYSFGHNGDSLPFGISQFYELAIWVARVVYVLCFAHWLEVIIIDENGVCGGAFLCELSSCHVNNDLALQNVPVGI